MLINYLAAIVLFGLAINIFISLVAALPENVFKHLTKATIFAILFALGMFLYTFKR